METNEICNVCGKCCEKHWLVKLSGKHELEMFKNFIVFGEYMFTDKCPYLKDSKCTTQSDKPHKCKEFFCEGKPPEDK